MQQNNKRKIFNPGLKNTMSSVVGGAGEASLPNSAPTPTGGVAATCGAVMASVSHDLFLDFIDKLKTPETSNLIESIKIGFNIINEGTYNYNPETGEGYVEQDEVEDESESNISSYSDGDHYKYYEPLDIEYIDNKFDIYTDDGDLIYTAPTMDDAIDFIRKTGNKIGHKPIKSYGNRWLNDMKEATIEDQVYMMDTIWNGRKTVALHKLSNDEIDAIRQKIKTT